MRRRGVACLVALSIGGVLSAPERAQADGYLTFKTVRSFGTDTLGGRPIGQLVEGPDHNFYGLTANGGAQGFGTLFRMQGADQATPLGFVLLRTFTPSTGRPIALRVGRDGNLYGLTLTDAGGGTIFKMSRTGSSLITLHTFVSSAPDGWDPTSLLFEDASGSFYGETTSAGNNVDPFIYRITPSGQYTVVASIPRGTFFDQYNFELDTTPVETQDGAFFGTTSAGLTLRGDLLFGMTYRFSPATGAFTLLSAHDHAFRASPTLGWDGGIYSTTDWFSGPAGIDRIDPVSGTLTRLMSFPRDRDVVRAGLALAPDGNFYGGRFSDVNPSDVFSFSHDGVLSVVHAFGIGADSVNRQLTVANDGTLYGVKFDSNSSGSVFRISLPWTGAFDGDDTTTPWVFPDWSFGEYKAECPFKQAVPVGLSAWPAATGGMAGVAHSILCKEPLGPDAGFWTDQTRSTPLAPAPAALSSVENVETFFDHDSADVRSHLLPQFPNSDWDQGRYKGECPLNKHVIGFAQTGDWSAPAPSGSGTKPPFTMDQILCSTSSCDSPSRPYVTRNQCSVRTLPGDDRPANLPEGDWASNFYKLQCADGQAIVGVSVDTTTHRPHRILCCQLELTTC